VTAERAIELQERAWALQAEGRLAEASQVMQEALHLIEEEDGLETPDVANLLNDLSEIESDRQNFDAALSLAKRAHAIEETLGDGFGGASAARIRIRTCSQLGEIRRMRGDYGCAEADLAKGLTIAVAEFGQASEEAAEARNYLAVLYKYWGRFDEALHLYEQALRTLSALHGEDSHAVAVLLHNIGGVLHAKGDFAAAEEPGRRAWDLSRRLFGEDDPKTLVDAAAYASILDGLERYEQSEPIYRHVLSVMERVFGAEHQEVAANLHNLAAVLAARGRPEEALDCYGRALTIKEKLFGAETPDTALTCNNIGQLLSQLGRANEGIPLLRRAVTVLEGRLTPEHPHLAAARRNLETALSSLAATQGSSASGEEAAGTHRR
jgi:tetratricopeptide (TPR) repeat protein